MCWQTMDRAIAVADLQMGHVPPEWIALREKIAHEAVERGFNRDLGAFTTAYDTPELDAAALHVGLSGMLPAHDPRFRSTVEAVERSLREGATVRRYKFDDGLPGREGGFHICAGWLAECYAMLGRRADAAAMLDSICGMAGPLGLLPEQYDAVSGTGLGNHVQAYSHLAVINTAIRLAAPTGGAGS
jgi:GH15 family glucan-1,4-alpha-glucosidase